MIHDVISFHLLLSLFPLVLHDGESLAFHSYLLYDVAVCNAAMINGTYRDWHQ